METSYPILATKIKDRTAQLAVIGVGYVGLPTAALFADAGFSVLAVDVKHDIIDSVNNGHSPIDEPGLGELIKRNVEAGRLKAVLNTQTLDNTDVSIISVQTPISSKKKPEFSYLDNAVAGLARTLRKGTLIVIGATVPPSTTMCRIKPALESVSGLEVEKDFYLAFVPERISPGNALQEFVGNARLVGGVGVHSTMIAAQLFRTVCKVVLETDTLTAELAKLAENTFRNVNIAFANELALMCETLGADVMKVIRIANTHPRVNIHLPGPGVGGPCLPKDPYLLLDCATAQGFKSRLIQQALLVNDSMPDHILELVLDGLRFLGKRIETSTITILGVSYKGGIGDLRNSPSERIIHSLLERGARTISFDPHTEETFGAGRATSIEEGTKSSDCIVILTEHPEFRDLKLATLKNLMNKNPIIVDGRRIIDPDVASRLGFRYYGVGVSPDK